MADTTHTRKTDPIVRHLETIKRLSSAEHFDFDDLAAIWKAANAALIERRIENERRAEEEMCRPFTHSGSETVWEYPV